MSHYRNLFIVPIYYLIIKEDLGEDYYDFESFWYVALTAFENKTGKELYNYIANDFKTNEETIRISSLLGKRKSLKL